MKYFAPERPRSAPRKGDTEGDPKLIDPRSGKPIGIMPTLSLEPLSDGRWYLRTHIAVGPTTARYRGAYVDNYVILCGVLADWLDDPEGVLERVFSHTWDWDDSWATPREKSPKLKVPTLEDLGL